MPWTTKDLVAHYQRQGLSVPDSIAAACDAKPTKYRSRKVVCGGISFDSIAESLFWQRLVMEQNHGVIRGLELQPRFLLQAAFRDEKGKTHRKVEYVADFSFLCIMPPGLTDAPIVVDVKSKATMTPTARLKHKLFVAKYPHLRLELWSYDYKRKIWEQING